MEEKEKIGLIVGLIVLLIIFYFIMVSSKTETDAPSCVDATGVLIDKAKKDNSGGWTCKSGCIGEVDKKTICRWQNMQRRPDVCGDDGAWDCGDDIKLEYKYKGCYKSGGPYYYAPKRYGGRNTIAYLGDCLGLNKRYSKYNTINAGGKGCGSGDSLLHDLPDTPDGNCYVGSDDVAEYIGPDNNNLSIYELIAANGIAI